MKHNYTITIDIKSQPFSITLPKKGRTLMTEGDAGWVNTFGGGGWGGRLRYNIV